MNTNKPPQPTMSISQMTPLPGESVQTSPDLFQFLLTEWDLALQGQTENPTSPPTQEMREGMKLLQNFSKEYFQRKNPPIQSTTDEGRVVITLSDNQKIQLGGEATEEFVPGSVLPSTAIKI